MANYNFKADYPEQYVALMIHLLSSLATFPIQCVSLELFTTKNERIIGVDGKIRSHLIGLRPFYMQFKRPYGWDSKSTSGIVKTRVAKKLSIAPASLFFNLLKLSKSQSTSQKPVRSQHNTLYSLRSKLQNWKLGDAAYVCPLFFDHLSYLTNIHNSALAIWIGGTPAVMTAVTNTVTLKSGVVPFNTQTFANHISIPPHATVLKAEHSYSFSPVGSDICFHSSPKVISREPLTLSDWIESLIPTEESPFISHEDSDELKVLLKATRISPAKLGPYQGFAAWTRFGDILQDDYGIAQYAFVKWKSTEAGQLDF